MSTKLFRTLPEDIKKKFRADRRYDKGFQFDLSDYTPPLNQLRVETYDDSYNELHLLSPKWFHKY